MWEAGAQEPIVPLPLQTPAPCKVWNSHSRNPWGRAGWKQGGTAGDRWREMVSQTEGRLELGGEDSWECDCASRCMCDHLLLPLRAGRGPSVISAHSHVGARLLSSEPREGPSPTGAKDPSARGELLPSGGRGGREKGRPNCREIKAWEGRCRQPILFLPQADSV